MSKKIKTLDFAKIKIGGEYYFDNNIPFKDFKNKDKIKKVIVLDLINRKHSTPLSIINNITDNCQDSIDSTHLQLHPDILKNKYKKLIKYYKKYKREYLINIKPLTIPKNSIIIGIYNKVNQVIYLTSEGIIDTCHISWIDWLDIPINQIFNDYMQNCYNEYNDFVGRDDDKYDGNLKEEDCLGNYNMFRGECSECSDAAECSYIKNNPED